MRRIIHRLFIVAFFIMSGSIVCSHEAHESNPLESASQENIQLIYQIMKDMHEVLTFYSIAYWIDGGTLLGAVRHRGLIPWDDDLDVCILKRDEERLLLAFPLLYKMGYSAIKMPFGYKVYRTNAPSIERRGWSHPFFDIFIIEQTDDILTYACHIGKPKRDGGSFFMKTAEVFPLKTYLFGPLAVKGPQDPTEYLQLWYGSDWNEVGYRDYDHSQEKSLKKIKVFLTDDMRKPALPGPLEQNFIVPDIQEWPLDFACATEYKQQDTVSLQ